MAGFCMAVAAMGVALLGVVAWGAFNGSLVLLVRCAFCESR
jgi:hypothetical protein